MSGGWYAIADIIYDKFSFCGIGILNREKIVRHIWESFHNSYIEVKWL